jgi:DNA-directed RNA polymerase subunit RPC12/RpoP
MIKLLCRSCGAKLELTDDIDRFTCLHCGSEWLVNRSGGIESLKVVEDKLEDVVSATKNIVEELKAVKSKEAILREEQLRIEAREEIKKQKEEEERLMYAEEKRQMSAEESRIREAETSRNKGTRIFSIILFLLALAINLVIGISMGSKEGSGLNLTGAIIGSSASAIGVLAVFFLLKLIFPKRGKAGVPGYILGILTILLGVAAIMGVAFLVGFLEIPGFTIPEVDNLMIIYYVSGLVWLIIMIWRGIESPAPLALIFGAIFGGVLFPLSTTFLPAAINAGFADPSSVADNMQMTRIAFAVLGALTGALGATAARASGFLLKWVE